MAVTDKALTIATAVIADLPTDFVANTARIESIIDDVSVRMADFCNRSFEEVTDLQEIVSTTGSQFLRLRHAPVTAISEVVRLDDDGNVAETITGVFIHRDGKAGLVFRRNGFRMGGTFEGSIDARTVVTPTPNRIRVTYSGGFATPGQNENDVVNFPAVTLPGDLQEACLVEVVNRFLNRGRNRDIDSRSTADATVTFREGSDLLKMTRATLKRYWLEVQE